MPKRRTHVSKSGFGFIRQPGGGHKKAKGYTEGRGFGNPAGRVKRGKGKR